MVEILNYMDCYLFLRQVVNEREEDILNAFKTFPKVVVTTEKIFNLITELYGPLLIKTFHVMSDITTLNTGRKAA